MTIKTNGKSQKLTTVVQGGWRYILLDDKIIAVFNNRKSDSERD